MCAKVFLFYLVADANKETRQPELFFTIDCVLRGQVDIIIEPSKFLFFPLRCVYRILMPKAEYAQPNDFSIYRYRKENRNQMI